MGNFWFVSAPLFGHLDWGGYLKTAQALRSQGHHVIWLSERSIGGYLQQHGIPFIPINASGWLWPPPPLPDTSSLNPQQARHLHYKRALDTWLSADLIPDAVRAMLNVAEQDGTPDVLVTDPFLSASAIVAEKMGVKMAVCGWPATAEVDAERLLDVQIELAADSRERIGALCAEFGVQGENFTLGNTPAVQSPHLHLSYFTAEWYGDNMTFLPQTKFVGGMPSAPTDAPPQWLQDLPDRPVVLITLGSVFTGDLGFFAWAAQAVARLGWVPIVVIGRQSLTSDKKKELIDALPAGTRLLNWVDFDHLMPRLHLIVHHGGMGTTHAALVHAVPQVVVPHAADQRGQARRVALAEVGVQLSAEDVQQGLLPAAIRQVGQGDRFRNNAQKLANQLATLGGPQAAAKNLGELLF